MQDNDRGKEGWDMTTMVLTPAFPRLPQVDGAVVRQLARYGVVGVLGTAVSALLYLLFRVWWDAVPANLAALVLSTVASTEANRRFTFRGVPTDRVREYLQNAATVAFYAVYSSAVLLLLDALVDEPTALQESVTIAGASVLGGLARFAVLRSWVFGDESRQGGPAKIGQSGAMIRLLPARRLLAAAAALGGLLLSTAASCGPSSPSVPATTPSVPTVAPSRIASEPGDDNGGGGGGGNDGGRNGGGRRGGSGEGEGRSGDG
jgi:putative flippase GtrA